MDLLVLNLDGSLLPACSIATSMSLRSLALPHVSVGEDGSGLIRMDRSRTRPLEMRMVPISFSFGLFFPTAPASVGEGEGEGAVASFVDLGDFEEENMTSTLLLTIDGDGNILHLTSNGFIPIDRLKAFVGKARELYSSVLGKLNACISE